MTIRTEDNIIGFYASFNSGENEQDQFMKYLWGENGLTDKLKSLKWKNLWTGLSFDTISNAC